MLADNEVKRLEEVQREYQSLCKEQASVRNSDALKKKYNKGLSPDEKQEVNLAIEREQDLGKRIDALVEERRSLIKKRDGSTSTDDSYSPYYDHRYGIRTDR